MKFPSHQRQRGMTLIVALVMLVLITMLAMTTFNLGKSSIQVVNNMQNRDEGINASRNVLDEAMSSTRFFETPEDALNAPCLNSNHRCYDVNGDGINDIVAALSNATCVKVRTIKSNELDLNNEEDRGCSLGASGDFGIVGGRAQKGDSMCADTVWEMTATSEDQLAQSRAEVVQGVGVRVSSDSVETSCK
jgi:Tfp pilus assembly protein PilX